MWELIEGNKRRALWLFVALSLIFLSLGFLIGETMFPSDMPFSGPGPWIGTAIAAIVALVLGAIAYWAGDDIVMSVSHAILVTKEQHPQLYNVTEEMKIAAGLERMPEIYLIADDSANAFATGIRPEKAAIAVTQGLVERLNREELQGVVAHEMAHIINRDVLFMSFAGVLLGSIAMVSEGFLRGFIYGKNSRGARLRGGGRTHPIVLLVTLVFAILAPFLARIFYFAASRRREYLADATAVRLTRYPEGLASALEKISATPTDMEIYNRFTAPLFIVHPFETSSETRSSFFAAGSTHPPVTERIRILRSLTGAGYRDYEGAFMKVTKKATLIPERMLRDKTPIPLRTPPPFAGEPSRAQKRRDLRDIALAAAGFSFLTCACGLKVKVPGTIGTYGFPCPRCGRLLFLPNADSGEAPQNTSNNPSVEETPLVYTRKGEQWESFSCSCGNIINLSPLFRARAISCRRCGRKITIEYPY